MILGTYFFEWNPDRATIPESTKTVATVGTYSGNALFQWEPILEGAKVDLWWRWMSTAQYDALKAYYLSLDPVVWHQTATKAYTVYVTGLDGKYIEVLMEEISYRLDVTLELNIRATSTESPPVTTTTTL